MAVPEDRGLWVRQKHTKGFEELSTLPDMHVHVH